MVTYKSLIKLRLKFSMANAISHILNVLQHVPFLEEWDTERGRYRTCFTLFFCVPKKLKTFNFTNLNLFLCVIEKLMQYIFCNKCKNRFQ